MYLFIELLVGAGLIGLTFIIQAICFHYIMGMAPWVEAQLMSLTKKNWKTLLFVIMVSLVSITLMVSIWVWALLYLIIEAVPDLESALYFSTTTFTTVGFGDIYLDKTTRMLSAIESMNGFLLFGWATAFIWEFITHIYKEEGKAIEQ